MTNNASAFSFDPSAMTDFMRGDFMKAFAPSGIPGFDVNDMATAQKRNVEALTAVNKAATTAYQDLYAKQVSVVEKAFETASKHIEGFNAAKAPNDLAQAQVDFAKSSMDTAVADLSMLAEEAQKANTTAYDAMAKHIETSIKDMTDKFSA